ncbi:MAG: DUF512 domain-containing protein [Clostridiales bacterium]|nr:DUF512 domain-containing protein [Clostridiales bacterium]
MYTVSTVESESLAQRHGIRSGDVIEKINGENLIDEVDYQALTAHRHVTLLIRKSDGSLREVDILKDPHTGLGIQFVSSLIGDPRSCSNNCIFCFIDQMPPDMRKTLYVKDDDWRMSLMMGNYVTLTNVGENEFNRIVRRKASPLYISVHATDPDVRTQMMNNKNAAKLMERLELLKHEQLQFHCQIVLCPGINDGEVLKNSLNDLFNLSPSAVSAALVPVGLTRFREGLTNLQPYTKEQAQDILKICDDFQLIAMDRINSRFVYPADEFLCLADAQIPEETYYEGYPQIENGVGMIRLFEEQLKVSAEETPKLTTSAAPMKVLVVCGTSILPYLQGWIDAFAPKNLQIEIKPIINTFFGETITVTGLIVGQDLVQQLQNEEADLILLSDNMLNNENTHFLDDMSLVELRNRLKPSIAIIKTNGNALFDAMNNADKLQKENQIVSL